MRLIKPPCNKNQQFTPCQNNKTHECYLVRNESMSVFKLSDRFTFNLVDCMSQNAKEED